MPEAFADRALAARVERGWAFSGEATAWSYAGLRPGAGVAVEAIGGGVAVYYGPGSPFSQAQGLGLDGPVSDAELDRLDAFFLGRGVASSVEVATLADPALWPALSARGYRVAETTHVLVRPVDGPDGGDFAPTSAASFVVDRAGGDDRGTFDRTMLRGFFEEPAEPPPGVAEVISAWQSIPDASGWLARVDGRPAGGALLLVDGATALFAGDATVPAFRRLGVQRALIRARLVEARRVGCDLAASCTQPGTVSQRNFERLGFRVVYARVLMVREPG